MTSKREPGNVRRVALLETSARFEEHANALEVHLSRSHGVSRKTLSAYRNITRGAQRAASAMQTRLSEAKLNVGLVDKRAARLARRARNVRRRAYVRLFLEAVRLRINVHWRIVLPVVYAILFVVLVFQFSNAISGILDALPWPNRATGASSLPHPTPIDLGTS